MMSKNFGIGFLMMATLAGCGSSHDTYTGSAPNLVQEAPSASSGMDLASFDRSVRPQDDIYRFANGAWLDTNEIPDNDTRIGAGDSVTKKVTQDLKRIAEDLSSRGHAPGSDEARIADLYKSFMDEARVETLGIEPMRDSLQTIAAISNREQLTSTWGLLSRDRVVGPLGFAVYADPTNPRIDALHLGEMSLSLPNRDYYLVEHPTYLAGRESLLRFATEMMREAGHPDPEAAAGQILALETAIAAIRQTPVEARDPFKTNVEVTVPELRALLAPFGWDAYARASGADIAPKVIINSLGYAEKFGDVFATQDVEAWKSLLTFRLLDRYASFMDSRLVKIRFAFFSDLYGATENDPRWKRGVDLLNNALSDAVGREYAQRHFSPESKKRVETMVANLLATAKTSLAAVTWMSETTKVEAQNKLLKMRVKIGYPDTWPVREAFEISPTDLVGNVRRFFGSRQAESLRRIGRPIDPTEWTVPVQVVNAYYSASGNEIVFPASFLQPPFFDPNVDDAANYGAAGTVIGHEIGHALDDEGSAYDSDGVLRDWWTEADREAFEAIGQVLVEQFDGYHPLPDLAVNGALTLGENLGDLTGVTFAFRAYERTLAGRPAPVLDGFTGPQRFFLSFASSNRVKARENTLRDQLASDPHAPPEFRVLGTLRNVDAFYQAFNVKPGDAMYLAPEDRAKLW